MQIEKFEYSSFNWLCVAVQSEQILPVNILQKFF